MPLSSESHAIMSDAEVLAASQKNPELFAVLVRKYEAPFLRRAKAILYSEEDAEDAVQETFTKIYLYADRYHEQPGATFSSWAYTILSRVAFTRYRARSLERGRRAELLPEHLEALPDHGADFLDDLSIRNEVLSALSKLPEAAARILRLQFIEGKTQEEIAAREQISVPAVKTRVHRAKKLFKAIFNRERYEP